MYSSGLVTGEGSQALNGLLNVTSYDKITKRSDDMSDDTVLRISCVYQCYLFVVIEAPVCRAVLIKTTISLTE